MGRPRPKTSKYQIAKQIMLQNPKMLPDRVMAKMKKKGVKTTKSSLYSMRTMMRSEKLNLFDGRKLREQRIKKIATQIMVENPEMLPDRVLAKMKKRGAETTRKNLSTMRHKARGEGHDLPNWRKLQDKQRKTGTFTMLDKPRAAIMKELWKTPRATTREIQRRLAKQKIFITTGPIQDARRIMKRWHPDIDFTPKPEPIKLTEAQEKMIPKFEREIKKAIWFVFKRKNWIRSTQIEFEQFMNGEIPRLIKNYDKTRAKINTYVSRKLESLSNEFVRQSVHSGTGLSMLDTRLLLQIQKEKSKIGEDGKEPSNKKVAKELGCNEEKVGELLEIYQQSLKIQARTGKRKEQ